MKVSEVEAITADLLALGEAECSILVAGEAFLKLAAVRAAIVVVEVAIIAEFPANDEFITADRCADSALTFTPVAIPARLN